MASQLTSVPNLLTIGRVAAVPLVCVLVAIDASWSYVLAFIVFVAAAVSDYLDGYLARAWKQGSPIGRMLDPIADKGLVGALLIVLAWTHSLSGWDLIPAVAIMLREILVSGLREYLGPRNVVVHVTWLAKWKTTSQLVALAIIILAGAVPGLTIIGQVLLWIAGVLTVWTGYEYYRGAWPHLVEDAS
jgi:CDP-diacylglycerol--glycerol-3-phosphate 3-phosphatidyltransferase